MHLKVNNNHSVNAVFNRLIFTLCVFFFNLTLTVYCFVKMEEKFAAKMMDE